MTKKKKTENKEYLSTSELASILGLSRDTIVKWCQQGKIKAIRIGKRGKYLIPKKILEEIGINQEELIP